MTLPGGILGCPRWQAFDEEGEPVAGAFLYSYITGGAFSTPQSLYTSSALTIALSNPVEADANGRFPAMYMLPLGYDLVLKDADDVQIWSCRNVEDIGESFLANLGSYLAEGRRALVSGDTILSSDLLVTVDGTGGPDPCIINLQPVGQRTEQLTVVNIGDVDVELTPDGSEQIQFVAAAFTVPAGATPDWPTVVLLPSQDDTSYVIVSAAFLT